MALEQKVFGTRNVPQNDLRTDQKKTRVFALFARVLPKHPAEAYWRYNGQSRHLKYFTFSHWFSQSKRETLRRTPAAGRIDLQHTRLTLKPPPVFAP